MNIALPALALTLLLTASAWAADPKVKTRLIDHSNPGLIDEATAKAVMDENIPAKVWKIHPASRYAFLSQVEGGVNAAGNCVVTARVMVLPLTATVRVPMFRPLPKLTATAYDSIPGAKMEQCQALAKEKLKTATEAVVSTIVKT
jgi:hypothetical protein